MRDPPMRATLDMGIARPSSASGSNDVIGGVLFVYALARFGAPSGSPV
jgi:hypothetical protein